MPRMKRLDLPGVAQHVIKKQGSECYFQEMYSDPCFLEGGIDYKAVAVGAATSLATYGAGQWASQFGSSVQVAVEAATSYTANYQFSKWAGYDVSWSNRQSRPM